MSTQWMIEALSDFPQANTSMIDLGSGNNTSIWSRITNVRLVKDGVYEFWKMRGGTSIVKRFTSTIVRSVGFETTIDAQKKEYIAVVRQDGVAQVFDIQTDTTFTIGTGFSQATDFVCIGIFLYSMRYDSTSPVYRVTNLKTGVSINWNSISGSPCLSTAWLTGAIVSPNIWGHDGEETYQPPYASTFIHRAYAIVNILEDGSVSFYGRPRTISTRVAQIVDSNSPLNSRVAVDLTMPPIPTGVARRILVATRFLPEIEDTTNPSSPNYPNGPFFIVGDIAESELSSGVMRIVDRTPDRQLIRPLSSILSMQAGVQTAFAPGQIRPKSVSSFKGTMVIGGYDVVYQVPQPYTSSTGSGNIRLGNSTGDNTDPAYTASFVFEYSNGRRSAIVDSDFVFKASEYVPGNRAFNTITITDNNLTGLDEGQITVTFDGVSITIFGLTSVSTLDSIAAQIASQLNSSSLTSKWEITVASNVVTIKALSRGTFLNGFVAFVSSYDIDVSLSGATAGGTDDSTIGNNQIQIHGLNALVESVILLAKTGSTYRVVDAHPITSTFVNGGVYSAALEDADFAALQVYIPPSSGSIVTSISQRDFISTAIPAQNPRIDLQARVQNGDEILAVVPMRFDSERTTLRYELTVLTTSSVQNVFLQETTLGNFTSYDISAEVIDPFVSAISPVGHGRVKDAVIFESNHGISIVSGRSVQLLLDKREYPFIESGLVAVLFNKSYSEIWLVFNEESEVIVLDGLSRTNRLIDYSGMGVLRGGASVGSDVLISIGDGVYKTDLASQGKDTGKAVLTVLTNAWTFGNLSDPFVVSDGTDSVSITIINDGGWDPIDAIASEITLRINEGDLDVLAVVVGNKIELFSKTGSDVTVTVSPEPELATPNGLYAIIVQAEVDIEGTLVSEYLSDELTNLKILDFTVYGQDITAQLQVDAQSARAKSSSATWSKSFTPTYTSSPIEAKMSGVSFRPYLRGRKPRILIKLTDGFNGFVESIKMKIQSSNNKGVAQ